MCDILTQKFHMGKEDLTRLVKNYQIIKSEQQV